MATIVEEAPSTEYGRRYLADFVGWDPFSPAVDLAQQQLSIDESSAAASRAHLMNLADFRGLA